jgi:N-acetylmuramoyl-L-alanine amidase
MAIAISSGHGKYIRGAAGSPIPPCLDEVNEARRVVEQLAEELQARGVEVLTYHDDVSTTQNENLNRIVDWHNGHIRDLDVSVHFNAFDTKAHGVEVLYVSQEELAEEVSDAIASCGFTNRGPKYRGDLFFLNNTSAPAILIETCFCDNKDDSDTYNKKFDAICEAIAIVLAGGETEMPVEPEEPDDADVEVGTCSHFGGPDDTGVSPSEGLAFIYEIDEFNQFLFLPFQPTGTTGLARRLNPAVHYCAMRWDYSVHPKDTLLQKTVLVRNPKTGFALTCTPCDWGPHEEKTGRLIDLSPSMMLDLDLETDDIVEVTFPWEG